MRVQQALYRLDVLLILKPGKHVQVVQRLGQVPSCLVSLVSGPSLVGAQHTLALRICYPHASYSPGPCE